MPQQHHKRAMLRRAKSFFIRRKKNEGDLEKPLPAEFLGEKTHLARKPIVVDPDKRLIAFKEPPDRPELNPMARSSCQLQKIGEKAEEGGVDLRPANFRRRSRPKTIDVPPGGCDSRLSFPPSKKVQNCVENSKTRIGSVKRSVIT